MTEPGSITRLVGRLSSGDERAAADVLARFRPRLLRIARAYISSTRVADEEDVLQVAFEAFCRGVANGQFAELRNREDVRQILDMITCRKAINQKQHERRNKRGGGGVRGESAFSEDDHQTGRGIERVPWAGPCPELATILSEEYAVLLSALDSDLQPIAVWKSEGNSNQEIAEWLNCDARTVRRRLKAIRSKLSSRAVE